MRPTKVCTENPDFPLSGVFSDLPWELSGGTKQLCLIGAGLILANNINTVIEIGCWQGYSSFALAKALVCNSDDPMLVTVDINARALKRSETLIKGMPLKFVTVCKDSYGMDLSKYVAGRKVGMVFVDGNHEYDWCMNDLILAGDILVPYGFILVHDYSKTGNNGVYTAVNEFIKKRSWPLFFIEENRESTDYRSAIIQKKGNY